MLQFSVTLCDMRKNAIIVLFLTIFLPNVLSARMAQPGDTAATAQRNNLQVGNPVLATSVLPEDTAATAQVHNSQVGSLFSAPAQLHKFDARELIVPAALVGIGAIGSQIDFVKEMDFGLRDLDLRKHHGFVVEDVLQYVPLASVYALKLSGVKSAHSYLDATVLAAGSFCVTGAAVLLLKTVVDEERPNGRDFDSFPSGHAAKAFMGAELLRREYKDTPVIGYAGYAVAAASSLMRVKHSEHWLPDIIAGAGIGILGTQVAYWVAPSLQKMLFGRWIDRKGLKSGDFAFVGMPFSNGEVTGVSLALVF